jgi:hypothetical protein
VIDKIKKLLETTILISFFAVFFLVSFYFVIHGNKCYIQISALSFAVFCAKSAVLLFCRSAGLIKGYKVHILSYQATVFCIYLFAIAMVAKCIF